jgi:AcrR family transcriptional regulator
MPRTSDKRERLIRSADQLILQQGYRQTTLSDIASKSGVPLGNVYYYFKTKEEIARTVIDSRLQAMQAILERCSQHEEPRTRLLEFLAVPVDARRNLSDHGCPLGTLAYEISRSENQLNEASGALISVVLEWCQAQFEAMGRSDARQLALQMVTNLQGMSLIANALHDPTVVDQMVDRTRDWINSL